ncbi:bifunctional endoribonuclease/protein kinase ire1 [Friedmanniomyces endolithicus]|nr:bifunctional endoribonuclease/protein kinase ire1 [Friedmanniomyces endolithicus]KAK0792452.1 bifunctional endoribonuclease/protein kinase ire1 [Friedmanniomyces endolithicus]KAK0795790.1 bifunctional endoribonuclease/protein kinase ire1 [Friedmanniomyces endolithicus]KAK0807542.1 bifunctional endoribonuclease/protein kinase ire1 [Friedmanniomyces endolithicus]KAK0836701.1 bifunctional endoribonuclease/protein kinase ire1 [Friedmanniomyces endolithicus]
MQPRPKVPHLKDLLWWSLFLAPVTAAALQQQPQHAYTSQAAVDRLSDAAASSQERWRASASDTLDPPVSGQRFKDTHAENRSRSRSREKQRTSNNERALATYAPAGSNPAVRAPPASRSSATAGLTSRQPARSLQDWQVEDIVLLATVDGKLHARDRTTGAARWQLEVDTPMVETTYHRHNRSVDENGLEVDDLIWIVEPSQDGQIYVYVPGSGLGMQRLGYTVKELADLAPYAGDGHLAISYTAEKKNTLYTIDAGTGNILKVFSSAGAITNDDRSCRRVNSLESLEEDDEKCEPIGTLLLGRTEYTIGVNTLNGVNTIRYFEWGPNNRDQDLKSKYTATMDQKYVYSRYDGSVFGLDLGTHDDYSPVPANKPVYREKFSSPVARVFDVVRPSENPSSDAALVVLPQPVGPALDELSSLDADTLDNVFVNCTESGSWYALSETNYPAVTEGAQAARCYSDDSIGIPVLPMSKAYRDRFTGVHQLSPIGHRTGTPKIGAADYPVIDPPPKVYNDAVQLLTPEEPGWKSHLPSVRMVLMTIIVASLAACATLYRERLRSAVQSSTAVPEIATTVLELPVVTDEQSEGQTPTMIRQSEPATETIFPVPDVVATPLAEPPKDDAELVRAESAEGVDEDEDDSKESKEAKGKHKRGKRGGRKAKEKEQAAAEARAKRKLSQVPQPAEVISVVASESPDLAGPLQINSLVIHKDKLIGQGSSGTLVFEGSFEGRDVAVKRMLSQHYELALQEVSFLQQSDDHPNVVRYFCQQKDDHFLYIAVELCQASLYDVWDADRAKTEDRQRQLQSLKLAIQQDTPRALQQLAAGLYHLHNLRIIHRDIKPQNILVAYPKRGQSAGPRLVISDFGLGKNLPENGSTINDATVNAGTTGWKAPELISQPKDSDSRHSQSNSHPNGSDSANGANGTSGIKRAADIFSLGCLFFWVLTNGEHPYEDDTGWTGLRELNIKRNKKNMAVLERWQDAYEPTQLIEWMLEPQPENRPTALQVLTHPFFWTAEKRLAFLCDASDHFEREARGTVDDDYAGDSFDLRLLEDRVGDVIGGRSDFLAKLDRQFVDTLGKQRKYSGNRLLDLLRALRNKKNHYEDMPTEVKARVGPLAGGYLRYWTDRFPLLLMTCYEVIHQAGIQESDRFRGYFSHDLGAM